jgi:hypothetical protein
MPAIADPYSGRDHAAASDAVGHPFSSRAPSLPVRVRTALHRGALTGALARGADPAASHELGLRAQQLTGDRRRRALARTLRRTIAEAHRPPLAWARMMMFRRSAVLEAEEAINAMIERLSAAGPVSAEGMAMAELILNNADRSPLYTPSEPGSLRRVVVIATVAMDPWLVPEPAHEFPLAA